MSKPPNPHIFSRRKFVKGVGAGLVGGYAYAASSRAAPAECPEEEESLSESLDSLIYSLDMNSVSVKKALSQFREQRSKPALSDAETMRLMLAENQSMLSDNESIETSFDDEQAKLVISVKFSGGKLINGVESWVWADPGMTYGRSLIPS